MKQDAGLPTDENFYDMWRNASDDIPKSSVALRYVPLGQSARA